MKKPGYGKTKKTKRDNSVQTLQSENGFRWAWNKLKMVNGINRPMVKKAKKRAANIWGAGADCLSQPESSRDISGRCTGR